MGDVGHRVLDTAMAAFIAEGSTPDKWGWGGAWRAWYFWAQSNLYFCAVDEAWIGARGAGLEIPLSSAYSLGRGRSCPCVNKMPLRFLT